MAITCVCVCVCGMFQHVGSSSYYIYSSLFCVRTCMRVSSLWPGVCEITAPSKDVYRMEARSGYKQLFTRFVHE